MAVMFASASFAPAQEVTTDHRYDALGRLQASSDTTGDARSYCYDAAGNRTEARGSQSGALVGCLTPPPPTPTPSPTPTPTPTPTPPSNNPPITQDDTLYDEICGSTKLVNLTANDSDPESNYPLVLVSISSFSGAPATILSNSTVQLQTPVQSFTSAVYDYVVRDSLGATSNGFLFVSTGGSCGGGGGSEPTIPR